MKRFRSILVVPVTDRPDPPAALREALALAQVSGAEIRILGHRDDPPACEEDTVGRMKVHDAVQSSYRERFVGWVRDLGVPDLPIEFLSGPLPEGVAAEVNERGHDLVVLARDDSAESAIAALRVMRSCPCSVWLLRPRFTGATVLAAIDPDHGIDHNRFVLELAASQAKLHDGHLRVMHSWQIPGLDLAASLDPGLDREALSDLVLSVEAAHREPFEEAIAAAGLIREPDIHLAEGPPARTIRSLAVLYRADLVVVGAGASPGERIGLGATAEQIVSESEVSVLIARPDAWSAPDPRTS